MRRSAGAIRTLAHGELPPAGVQPRRYRNGSGYIRLRWASPDGGLIECYEHRWVMGNPPAGYQVHHKNHIRDDNRPENLVVLSPAEHGAEHRSIDRAEVLRLYQQGLATTAVGKQLNCDAAQVYRIVAAAGIAIRSISEAKRYDETTVPPELIARLHRRGVRASRIAELLGTSAGVIHDRVEELGLEKHRPGRPTREEVAAADAAIAELAR